MQTPSNCPLCLKNNLLRVDVLFETEGGYLIESHIKSDYLIIPKNHVETLDDLQDSWWVDFKKIFPMVPGIKEQYNLSLNVGKDAGQTLKHLHFWVVPRTSDMPSSGKGLATLITEIDQAKP